ncbi:hypothetical protein [Streptomyces sp. NPDC056883]|uniref:hypothetical protein n=1 Tax=Streptomyces sp. NPDC056883 TaxID=3345959 RepID=UPI0036810F49
MPSPPPPPTPKPATITAIIPPGGQKPPPPPRQPPGGGLPPPAWPPPPPPSGPVVHVPIAVPTPIPIPIIVTVPAAATEPDPEPEEAGSWRDWQRLAYFAAAAGAGYAFNLVQWAGEFLTHQGEKYGQESAVYQGLGVATAALLAGALLRSLFIRSNGPLARILAWATRIPFVSALLALGLYGPGPEPGSPPVYFAAADPGPWLGDIGYPGAALAVTVLMIAFLKKNPKKKIGQAAAALMSFVAASLYQAAGGPWQAPADSLMRLIDNLRESNPVFAGVGYAALCIAVTLVIVLFNLTARRSAFAGFLAAPLYNAAGAGYAMVAQFVATGLAALIHL